jgi:hypothetical protein
MSANIMIQLLGHIERRDYEYEGKQYFIGGSSLHRAIDEFLDGTDTYEQGCFVNRGPRVRVTIERVQEEKG